MPEWLAVLGPFVAPFTSLWNRVLSVFRKLPDDSPQSAEDELIYSRNDVRVWVRELLPTTKIGEVIKPPTQLANEAPEQSSARTIGGAITYEGGQTTEATSTSTVMVDLQAVAGLDVGFETPLMIVARFIRTSGTIQVGLKLNDLESTAGSFLEIPHDAGAVDIVWYVGGGTVKSNQTVFMQAPALKVLDNDIGVRPIANIHSVTIRAASGSASAMVGIESLTVYSLPEPVL